MRRAGRPVWRGNKLKKRGARSARARTRGQNPLVNYIDTKAKCRHFNKPTCKGTLRQVFNKVYRLEIQSVMLVFSTQVCELLPLFPSHWFTSSPHPPPPPGVNKYSVYTYSVCKGGGGYGVLGLRQINTCMPQSSFTSNFFR